MVRDNKYNIILHFLQSQDIVERYKNNPIQLDKFKFVKQKNNGEVFAPPLLLNYFTLFTEIISPVAFLSTVNVIVSPTLRITILSASFTATL